MRKEVGERSKEERGERNKRDGKGKEREREKK